MARIAVLDANVLWPQYLRDVLIRAAIFDMYRAAWTDRIIEEMQNSLIRAGRVRSEQIDRTVRLMRETGDLEATQGLVRDKLPMPSYRPL